MNRFLTFYYRHIKPSFLRKPLYTAASEAPFFILSSGRSGSTLLRKLLLMHSPVNIPPESNDLIPKLIKFYLRYNHKPWEYIVRNCIEIYNKEEAVVYWKARLEDDDLKTIFSSHWKDKSLAGIIYFLYDHYSKVHLQQAKLWGDKTPFLIYRLKWINMLYPNSRFIFLIRDGRAVVNSFLKMNKGFDMESASVRWLESIHAMEAQQKTMKKEQVLYIRYEDLVTKPQIEMKKVYDFLQINPQAEAKENIFLGDDVLSHHHNIHSSINPDSIDKWKTELSQKDIAQLTMKMGVALRKYGYY